MRRSILLLFLVAACNPPSLKACTDADDCDEDGFTVLQGDCDDTKLEINPGTDEACDGVDNDCDGYTDEGSALGFTVYLADHDGDGYGDFEESVGACTPPPGTVTWTAYDVDCDDDDASVHPDAVEVCDGQDNDCDGIIDSDADSAIARLSPRGAGRR